jgi:hypothetical protein
MMQKNIRSFLILQILCCFLFAACPPPVSNTVEDPKGITGQNDDGDDSGAGENIDDGQNSGDIDNNDDDVNNDDNDANDDSDSNENDDNEANFPVLAGTAWEWSAIKLTFRSDTRVSQGTANYSYTYDTTERTGNIVTLGDFSISEDFLLLSFADYQGTGPREFVNLSAALTGSSWRFGRALLKFSSATKVSLHGFEYSYTYDPATRTGSITANFGQPGPFTISEDETTLTFSNYRDSKYNNYAIPVVFAKVAGADQEPGGTSLTGSDWWWTGTSLHLDFITETVVLLWSFTGYYVPPILFDYTWNAADGTGRIYNGRNDVGTKYDLGDYAISGGLLNFIQYGPYPHGAAFYVQE